MVLVNKKLSREPRRSRTRNRPEWELPELNSPDEPLPGLLPAGNGFYSTGGGSVSPFDCTRWPDSPYCGGNPFTEQGIGFNFSRVQDECNIGIQAAPVLGFVKLPLIQFVYRYPGQCRLPPPPPERPVTEAPACVSIFVQGVDVSNETLSVAYRSSYSEYIEGIVGDSRLVTIDADIVECKFLSENYFAVVTFAVRTVWIDNLGDPNFSQLTPDDDQSKNVVEYIKYGVINTGFLFSMVPLPGQGTTSTVLCEAAAGFEAHNYLVQSKGSNLDWVRCYENYYPVSNSIYAFTLPDPEAPPTLEFDSSIRGFSVEPEPFGTFFGVQYVYSWDAFTIENYRTTVKVFNTNFEKLPPPPPDDRKCKCMCCDDSLLKLLLSRINKIYNTVGVDDYPVSAPQWITKDNSPQISIANITRFISYTVKQLDAISGNYPIKIKIQDADLTQEGNQEKTVTLPNAAEALAEIVGLLLAIRSETNASLIASVNGMIEAGSSKQLAFLAQEYAKANAEFLAYKGRQVERELPYTFTPNESQLDKMMKPKTVKVKGWENDDKDDFTDAIAPLLELAAMWKAQNFRNLGAASPVEKLSDILRGANQISDLMSEFRKSPPTVPDPNNPDAPPPEPKKDEWDTFVEEAEQGFITKPGITDNIRPYGRPLDQRPRIREIGDDTSDTNQGST